MSAGTHDAAQSSRKRRIAVLGGGLSGLSACWSLLKRTKQESTPVEITLFEANDRFGGVFGTIAENGYRLETGADMFITNKPGALQLAEELGLQSRLIGTNEQYRRSLILRNGRPIATPAGFDLMVPRNLWAFAKSPLLSPWGKCRVAAEYFLPGRAADDETLSSFAKRRFGNEAFARIIQPMIGGIYTADPDRLSLRATLPRFLEMEAEHGSLIKAALREKRRKSAAQEASAAASGARYGLFLSFDDGMSVLQDELVAAVEQECRLRCNTRVISVRSTAEGRYEIQTAESDSLEEYDAVLFALPAHQSAGLMTQVAPEAARLLGEIEYASAAIVVTGYKLEQVKHPLDCFGLVIPAVEKRKILAVSCTSRKFPNRAPEGSVQLRTFVGGAMQQQLLKHSDAELEELVKGELDSIFGISGQPEITKVVRWNRAMPQYHLGHVERVQKIESQLEAIPGMAVAGNALQGVGLPDVIQTSQRAVDSLWNGLFPAATAAEV